jgi:DNA-binding transcriptional LysR family regulator
MSLAGKDLNLLIALRALLEERNVTRAADRLGIGQSGMSAALRRLRTHYGDDLLVRVGREYDLSPMARLLLTQVQRTVPLIEQSLSVSTPFDPATAVRDFTIAASDFVVVELHSALSSTLAEYPGISFTYSPWGEELLDETFLSQQDFVVAIPGHGLEAHSATLLVDRFVCVVDQHHPAATRGALTWEEFIAAPQIAADFGSGIEPPYEQHLSGLKVFRNSRVSTRGFLPIPAIVAGTQLVGIVPSRLAARICAPNGTAAVEPPFGHVPLIEMLCWNPSLEGDGGHSWARALILDIFSQDPQREISSGHHG